MIIELLYVLLPKTTQKTPKSNSYNSPSSPLRRLPILTLSSSSDISVLAWTDEERLCFPALLAPTTSLTSRRSQTVMHSTRDSPAQWLYQVVWIGLCSSCAFELMWYSCVLWMDIFQMFSGLEVVCHDVGRQWAGDRCCLLTVADLK